MSIEVDNATKSRRSVVKATAWSVPVIAAAIAAPAASASGETPPPATFWLTGATASVVSGNTTKYTLEGQDSNSDSSLLPIGSTTIVKPGLGVTLAIVRSSAGTLAEIQGDGSILVTVIAADVTLVDLRFIPTGPLGAGYTITTNVSITPFTEDIDVVLQ